MTLGDERTPAVVHVIHHLEPGGAERRLLSLLGSLDRSRYRPLLVCVDRVGALAPEAHALGLDPVVLGRGARWDVSGVRRLARIVRTERASIVHGWLFLGNAFARVGGQLGRAPVLIASEGAAITTFSATRLVVGRTVETLLAPLTNAFIANSEATAAGMRRLGVPARKIDVIHNGVALSPPLDDEERTRLRRELGVSDATPLVVMVARLDPAFKDHSTFLRAMALLPQARAAVVGDGSGRQAAERLAAELGIGDRVVFTGFRSDAARVVAAADVSVLLTYSEGFSNVVLESMAAGVPVVATDIPSNREAIRDGADGLIVAVGSAEATADAIGSFLAHPELARAVSAAARVRIAKQFSLEAQAERTMALYDRLLSTRRR
ncbi:MAG: hypothetical protein QOH95_1333 [Gaiellaceae bacterium]|nr:hypothetical protein [Gaiellaceae bacterium]